MLKGIDISNWQGDIQLDVILPQIDFCIVKATEGIGFTDKYCDKFIQKCIEHNKKWGFYHFMRTNNPIKEADYFYKETKNYFKHGIPILDIEDSSIPDWGRYAQEWVDRIHALSGVYPMIYTSAAYLSRFRNTTLPNNCGLWLAGYPKPYTAFGDYKLPYSISPWNICAIWQFTSNLRLNGYSGNLDGDMAYMDGTAWDSYAGVINNVSTDVENSTPTNNYTLENDKIKVDVTLK